MQDGPTPLRLAAYFGNERCVELLLAAGANLNALDLYGRSALHFASEDVAEPSENGRSERCLVKLVVAGAQLDAQDMTARLMNPFRRLAPCVCATTLGQVT